MIFESGPIAIDTAALNVAAEDKHAIRVAVVRAAIPVFLRGAAELAHRDHDNIRHAIAHVLMERGQRLPEFPEQIGQLALHAAFVDVVVPSARFFDSVDLQNAGFDIEFDSNGNIANITAPDFNVAVLNGNGDQAGVIGPDTDLTAGTVQMQQSVSVYASIASSDTYSSPVTGKFVELPAVDAGPMAPSAKRMLRAIAAASPTVCGGGFFVYAGVQPEKDIRGAKAEGFLGYLGEWDSNTGWSNNGLVELGTSKGSVGVAGSPSNGIEPLLFVPAGPYGGGVAGPSSVGAYLGTPGFAGVGGGVYVNIMPNGTCSAIRQQQNGGGGNGGGDGF